MTENATCRWVDDNIEAYLFNDLAAHERRRLDDHRQSCPECARELESHLEVEQLVRAVYRERLASARARHAGSAGATWRLGPALAGVGIAAILILTVGLPVRTPGPDPTNMAGNREPDKTDDVSIERAKPEEAPDGVRDPVPAVPPPDRPEFSLEDRAGYLLSLDDFRGSALIIGVLGENDIDAFRETYEQFRGIDSVRFIGVPLDPGDAPVGLPTMRNRGNSVLDTPPGGFVLVGPDGSVDGRGRVSDPEFPRQVERWIEAGLSHVRVE